MELGIRGRKAIVCASSQGLGRGCALGLAEAGVSLVINGRNHALLDRTAEEIRRAAHVEVTPVVADVSTREGHYALLAACPNPDILVNNNGGPPFRDFRELDRAAKSLRSLAIIDHGQHAAARVAWARGAVLCAGDR